MNGNKCDYCVDGIKNSGWEGSCPKDCVDKSKFRPICDHTKDTGHGILNSINPSSGKCLECGEQNNEFPNIRQLEELWKCVIRY